MEEHTMTNIRAYADSIGFEVIGKLKRFKNYDRHCRIYLDEGGNEYLVDTLVNAITIITNDGCVI
jgi:hypothetical protein